MRGHGVSPALARGVRIAAREFFALQRLVTEYTVQMRRVADDLLALFAHALGLPTRWACPRTRSRRWQARRRGR